MVKKPHNWGWWSFIAAWVGYFTYFWLKAFWTDDRGNLVVGHINLWGDWAAHFSMGSRFAYVSMTNLMSPLLINARLSYPFVTNWLAGGLIRLGVPFVTAFVILSWLGSIATVLALVWFYQTWFKSKMTAVLATLIFLWNGGLGFIWYLNDAWLARSSGVTALIPRHEYTHFDQAGLRWMSVIDSMIVPQRAFTLGFPLALALLVTLWHVMHQKNWPQTWWWRVGIGIGWGILPIIHTHSFLAVSIILAAWALADLPPKVTRPKLQKWLLSWLAVGAPAVAIATPLYLYFFASHTGHNFIQWQPGWYAAANHENWLWWWFKNWGLVPWIAGFGSWMWITSSKRDRRQRTLWVLPFWLLFGLVNLFLFQPYIWDNTKLLVWASLGISGLAAYGLHFSWQRWSKPSVGWWGHSLRSVKLVSLAIVALSLVASGAIDAYWVIRPDLHNYVLYTREELELAEWVRANTPPASRWITSDQHNHWLYNLTGRQTMLGYRGWVWTHGYDYSGVERDLKHVLAEPAHYHYLMDSYDLEFAVVGPSEKADWAASDAQWGKVATPIKKTDNYTIFQIQR